MREGEYQPEQQGRKVEGVGDPYLKGMIDQGVSSLLAELQQGKSDHLLAYLAFSARFHRYSLYNQLLIYAQCPRATRVAGYKTWQKLGYQVARGQKGIRILAPRPYVHHDDETDEDQAGIYFVNVAVFDASQLANTAERPLPEFWTPLQDDQHELCVRLEQAIREDGIAIRDSARTDSAQGYSAHGEIVLKDGLDSRSRFFVLTHEYAHELLHWNEEAQGLSKQVQECHAEATSYIVAAHCGLHNPRSSDYLQNWGNTPADLLSELDVITKTAAYIIDRLQSKEDGHESERAIPSYSPFRYGEAD